MTVLLPSAPVGYIHASGHCCWHLGCVTNRAPSLMGLLAHAVRLQKKKAKDASLAGSSTAAGAAPGTEGGSATAAALDSRADAPLGNEAAAQAARGSSSDLATDVASAAPGPAASEQSADSTSAAPADQQDAARQSAGSGSGAAESVGQTSTRRGGQRAQPHLRAPRGARPLRRPRGRREKAHRKRRPLDSLTAVNRADNVQAAAGAVEPAVPGHQLHGGTSAADTDPDDLADDLADIGQAAVYVDQLTQGNAADCLAAANTVISQIQNSFEAKLAEVELLIRHRRLEAVCSSSVQSDDQSVSDWSSVSDADAGSLVASLADTECDSWHADTTQPGQQAADAVAASAAAEADAKKALERAPIADASDAADQELVPQGFPAKKRSKKALREMAEAAAKAAEAAAAETAFAAGDRAPLDANPADSAASPDATPSGRLAVRAAEQASQPCSPTTSTAAEREAGSSEVRVLGLGPPAEAGYEHCLQRHFAQAVVSSHLSLLKIRLSG